jgi:hypothetical protein
MKAAVRRNVSLDDDEFAGQGHCPDQIQKERLSAAKTPDDKPNRRTPLFDTLQIPHQGRHFIGAPDLDVLKSDCRNDAGRQRLNNRAPLSRANGPPIH